MNKIHTYIASPYTNGLCITNVKRQLEAMHILMDYKFIPFVPLLNHFAHDYKNRDEEDWMIWDLEWLEFCDILIRIKPLDKNNKEITSFGADREVKKAKSLNIPVFIFKDLDELINWCKNINKQFLYNYIKALKEYPNDLIKKRTLFKKLNIKD